MKWTKRWGYEVRPTKTTGVMSVRDGRYLVHGKVSQDGHKRTIAKVITAPSVRDAARARLEMLGGEREKPQTSTPLFSEYAPSLYERKVAQRDLKSAKTRERWDTTLRLHLLPAFGRFAVDALTKPDIEAWKTRLAKQIADGKLSPRTANGWLSILRVIVRSAGQRLDAEHRPEQVAGQGTAEQASGEPRDRRNHGRCAPPLVGELLHEPLLSDGLYGPRSRCSYDADGSPGVTPESHEAAGGEETTPAKSPTAVHHHGLAGLQRGNRPPHQDQHAIDPLRYPAVDDGQLARSDALGMSDPGQIRDVQLGELRVAEERNEDAHAE
jgi:hypothetical protein